MTNVWPTIREGLRHLNVFGAGNTSLLIPAADNEPERQTYGGSVLGMSLAATPQDILTIQGSATKLIRLKSIVVNALSASTGAYPLQIVRRSVANTGGTNTVVTAFQHDIGDPAAQAVVRQWTVNPTGLGAQVGGAHLGRVVGATASNLDRMVFQYSWQNDKAIVINGATDFIALNMNGAALAASTTVDIDLLWTEEGQP